MHAQCCLNQQRRSGHHWTWGAALIVLLFCAVVAEAQQGVSSPSTPNASSSAVAGRSVTRAHSKVILANTPAATGSGIIYEADCNDPDAYDLNCTEPTRALIQQAQEQGYAYYIGHAEPTTEFFSTRGTSGYDMQWKLQLPATEPSPTQNGVNVANFELYSTFWLGLALCDPNSNPFGACVAASDTNNPGTAGAAFLELQFYPPGINCSNTQWCVSRHINTWQDKNSFQVNNCLEPTTAALLTTNGVPGGPTLLMNNGDTLVVTIHDTANGLETDVNDVSTSTTGSMVASGANGFLHNANQQQHRLGRHSSDRRG